MAKIEHRLPENVTGDFFVDASCIDCDTCTQLAPAVFRDHGDQCSVYHQPETEQETKLALMALVACPTGSIGTIEKHDGHIGIDAFPSLVSDNARAYGLSIPEQISFHRRSSRLVADSGNVNSLSYRSLVFVA